MKRSVVQFVGKGQVEVVEEELRSPGPGEVLVEAEVSLMSTGTENIVLNRLFDPGTHWDNWVKYPFHPGYSMIGIVKEVGEGVETLQPGDRVACTKAHASSMVFPASEFTRVPEGVRPEDAAWFALAQITYNGARNAGFGLGQNIAVVGLGPIGQMTLRWALVCGAERVMGIDPLPMRLEIAKKAGAAGVFGGSVDDAEAAVREVFGGLPNTVADTTGHSAVFSGALKLVATMGKLLLVGDTGSPATQHLTSDVVPRGLTICGAHMMNPYPDRTMQGTFSLFFELVRSGRFRMDGLLTHEFRGVDAPQAYALANEKRGETMGLLFRW